MGGIALLIGLVVLIFLAFYIPLDMTFRMEADGRLKFRMRLFWFFGLVRKELGKKKKPEEQSIVADAKPKPSKKGIGTEALLKILRTKGLLGRLQSLVRDIIRCLSMKEFEANFRIGLDDPADTGFLFALIGPATLFLGSAWGQQIRVTPSFEDEVVFEGFMYGTVRLRPIQLIPPFLRFVFSWPLMQVLRILVVTQWKSKR